MSIKTIATEDLRRMSDKEGIVFQGCGGDPQEWLDGINVLLTDEGVLKNGSKFENICVFKHESLTNILFPFEDGVELDMGKFAIWRLLSHGQFGGTWLSDYVPNSLGGFLPKNFAERVAEIENTGEIYTSPDFQCDQTGGFPTSLCVCWEQNKAWLSLNRLMIEDGKDVSAYEQMCADYGIRLCCGAEQYNELLKDLGEDAYNTAYLPEDGEAEGLSMGGI